MDERRQRGKFIAGSLIRNWFLLLLLLCASFYPPSLSILRLLPSPRHFLSVAILSIACLFISNLSDRFKLNRSLSSLVHLAFSSLLTSFHRGREPSPRRWPGCSAVSLHLTVSQLPFVRFLYTDEWCLRAISLSSNSPKQNDLILVHSPQFHFRPAMRWYMMIPNQQ